MNRYDTPALAEFINTYVPIPFELLFGIGEEMNARRDAAEKIYRDTITDWKKFYSPSAVDTENWAKATYESDSAKEIIDRYISDPNYVKTAEGQAALANLANNANIGQMLQLLLNALNLNTYLKNRAELEAKGLYNKDWDDVDVVNYNTLEKGVLSQLSPLEYRSVTDIVKPFVDNLHPSFIEGDGQYLYKGVSKLRTRDQVDQNLSSILNQPFAAKHIATIKKNNPNMTDTDAVAEFMKQAYTAAEEFSWTDREYDPVYIALLRSNGTRTKGNGGNSDSNEDVVPLTLTESISLTGKNLHNNLYLEMFSTRNAKLVKAYTESVSTFSRAAQEYKSALTSGNRKLIEEKKTAYETALGNYTKMLNEYNSEYQDFLKQDIRRMIKEDYYDIFGEQTTNADRNRHIHVYTAEAKGRAVSSVIDKISVPISPEVSPQILAGISSTSELNLGTGNKARVFTNTSKLQLVSDFVDEFLDIHYTEGSPSTYNLIARGLRNNDYRNVRIMSVDGITSVNNGTSNKAVITIAIPYNQIFKDGDSEELNQKKLDAIAYAQGNVNKYKSETSFSDTYEGTADDKSNERASESYRESNAWVELPVVVNLPNTGEGTFAELFNQHSWQQNLTPAKAAELFHRNQWYNVINLK